MILIEDWAYRYVSRSNRIYYACSPFDAFILMKSTFKYDYLSNPESAYETSLSKGSGIHNIVIL